MCKCIFKCICKYSMWILLNLTRRWAALKMDPAVLSLESISWPSGRITSWCVWTLIHSSIFLKSHSRSLSVHTLSTGVSTLSAHRVSTLSAHCIHSIKTGCLNSQCRMSTLSTHGVHALSTECPQSEQGVHNLSTKFPHSQHRASTFRICVVSIIRICGFCFLSLYVCTIF